MADEKYQYCMMMFGSSLFGDYLKKEEEDTLWENKAFNNLKDYLEENHSRAFAERLGTTQDVLDAELKRSLKLLWECADCEKAYRDKLIPTPNTSCYRGMGLPVAYFNKFSARFGKPSTRDRLVRISTSYPAKRVVESWSTDYLTSLRFTYGPSNYSKWKNYSEAQVYKEWGKIADMMEAGKEPVAYIPCIWEIKAGSNHNCIFNPDFTDLLSSWQQREVLRFGTEVVSATLTTHTRFVELAKKA